MQRRKFLQNALSGLATVAAVLKIRPHDAKGDMNLPVGLEINPGFDDDEIISLKSQDVNGGVFDISESDIHSTLTKYPDDDDLIIIKTTGRVKLMMDNDGIYHYVPEELW